MEETGFLELAAKVLGVPPGSVSLETSRAGLEAWDSINHIRLVMEAEKEAGVRLPLKEIPAISTLGDLFAKLGGGKPHP